MKPVDDPGERQLAMELGILAVSFAIIIGAILVWILAVVFR